MACSVSRDRRDERPRQLPYVPGEAEVVGKVRLDDGWELVEELSRLRRDSGSEDESLAVERIVSRLSSWSIPVEVHRPELLVSLSKAAALEHAGVHFPAKTPSMSASTRGSGVTAPLSYLPASFSSSVKDIFSSGAFRGELSGKIVVTEGLPFPGEVASLAEQGAVGVVLISPGERIHEGIVSTVWGSPDLRTSHRLPSIPVVSISNSSGDRLRAQILAAPNAAARLHAEHETSWRPVPIVVAEVTGAIKPERFVLLHAHLDSWHMGVGDNATGDAVVLEVARVLRLMQDRLLRSVRICWWSGHSHGRYAGSTWFADEYAGDIEENCICHINCDSPGCRDASVADLYSMTEMSGFACDAVKRFAKQETLSKPVIRAGDCSFSNLGVPTFFMLSAIPNDTRSARGLYSVGGCGGNIEWHAEDDDLRVADNDHLLRDMRLFTGAVFRAANLPVHPLVYGPVLHQIEDVLSDDYRAAGEIISLSSTHEKLRETAIAISRLYDGIPQDVTVEGARGVNDVLLRIGRQLVNVLYSAEGRYRQDPAINVPLLPDFANAVARAGEEPSGVIRTELIRARNRLEGALSATTRECRNVVMEC